MFLLEKIRIILKWGLSLYRGSLVEEKTVGDPSPRLLEPYLDMPRMRV